MKTSENTANLTGKQRMLNAYRGIWNDRITIAPEFWCYYPAKILKVDMITFQREVPFHVALKKTFEKFNCEGWGVVSVDVENKDVQSKVQERWIDKDILNVCTTIHTALGQLTQTIRYHRKEPAWVIERPLKNLKKDLAAWELASFGDNPDDVNISKLLRAREEAGETYLLEASLGAPFFDFYANSREGGFETAIYDFCDPDFIPYLKKLQTRYIQSMTRKARFVCEKTPFESMFIGCSWSCNSLIGPEMWRLWDKPLIKAVAEEIHRHGKLLHIHFHGRCLETVADFTEMEIDCVCPFERPPGGNVNGIEGLRSVAKLLQGRVTMNGNVHTVNTLIRGKENDVRREVREIMDAFKNNPRVIVGTGDQVGWETPEENLYAMIDEAKHFTLKTRKHSENQYGTT